MLVIDMMLVLRSESGSQRIKSLLLIDISGQILDTREARLETKNRE